MLILESRGTFLVFVLHKTRRILYRLYDFSMSEFIVSMTNTIMLFVSHINKVVVSTPVVRVDDTVRIDFPADYCPEGFPGTVGYDLGIDFATALEDDKDRCFTRCTPSTFSFYASGSEIGFVNLNLSGERR